jgi:hypothetical protein
MAFFSKFVFKYKFLQIFLQKPWSGSGFDPDLAEPVSGPGPDSTKLGLNTAYDTSLLATQKNWFIFFPPTTEGLLEKNPSTGSFSGFCLSLGYKIPCCRNPREEYISQTSHAEC